ncbi:MAG: hypothetical protein ACOX9R_02650 [Armatimonadota bacterium]|jgi:hypothetical protein
MRSRLAHAAVFIGAFCLFLGYCEWWKDQRGPEVNSQSPPDFAALTVAGAADESFNGVYVPIPSHDAMPCFMKEAPRRFLWRSAFRWHLSTELGMISEGYMSEYDAPLTGPWLPDGAPEPCPTIEAPSDLAAGGRVTPPVSPPGSYSARRGGSRAMSQG